MVWTVSNFLWIFSSLNTFLKFFGVVLMTATLKKNVICSLTRSEYLSMISVYISIYLHLSRIHVSLLLDLGCAVFRMVSIIHLITWLILFLVIWDYSKGLNYYWYYCHIRLHIILSCPVGWGCRIHWLHLCRGVSSPNECPVYDTKQSNGEVPVMLALWRMRSTPSLPSLPGPLWPGVVESDRTLSMG